MSVVLVAEDFFHLPLHLCSLREVLGVQSHALLRLEALKLLLQLWVDVLVFQNLRDAVGLVRFGAPMQQVFDLLADLHNAGLAELVPVLVGHQISVHAQVAQEGFRPQVSVDLHALVDVIEELRGVLPRPGEDGRGATGMTVHELREVVDLAVKSHPAVLRRAMTVHLGERDVLGDGGSAGLMDHSLLEVRDACWVLVGGLGCHDRRSQELSDIARLCVKRWRLSIA
mmetsp:Transcript_22610/g.46567  ORF Transcript_22610/g.46567 Transcript_22610/m.46567 type:complete len:227 (-) Transcript_22610:22-702(-)